MLSLDPLISINASNVSSLHQDKSSSTQILIGRYNRSIEFWNITDVSKPTISSLVCPAGVPIHISALADKRVISASLNALSIYPLNNEFSDIVTIPYSEIIPFHDQPQKVSDSYLETVQLVLSPLVLRFMSSIQHDITSHDIIQLEVSPVAPLIVLACCDGTVVLFDVDKKQTYDSINLSTDKDLLRVFHQMVDSANQLTMTPNTAQGTTNEIVFITPTSLSFSIDGSSLFIGTSVGTIVIYDVNQKTYTLQSTMNQSGDNEIESQYLVQTPEHTVLPHNTPSLAPKPHTTEGHCKFRDYSESLSHPTVAQQEPLTASPPESTNSVLSPVYQHDIVTNVSIHPVDMYFCSDSYQRVILPQTCDPFPTNITRVTRSMDVKARSAPTNDVRGAMYERHMLSFNEYVECEVDPADAVHYPHNQAPSETMSFDDDTNQDDQPEQNDDGVIDYNLDNYYFQWQQTAHQIVLSTPNATSTNCPPVPLISHLKYQPNGQYLVNFNHDGVYYMDPYGGDTFIFVPLPIYHDSYLHPFSDPRSITADKDHQDTNRDISTIFPQVDPLNIDPSNIPYSSLNIYPLSLLTTNSTSSFLNPISPSQPPKSHPENTEATTIAQCAYLIEIAPDNHPIDRRLPSPSDTIQPCLVIAIAQTGAIRETPLPRAAVDHITCDDAIQATRAGPVMKTTYAGPAEPVQATRAGPVMKTTYAGPADVPVKKVQATYAGPVLKTTYAGPTDAPVKRVRTESAIDETPARVKQAHRVGEAPSAMKSSYFLDGVYHSANESDDDSVDDDDDMSQGNIINQMSKFRADLYHYDLIDTLNKFLLGSNKDVQYVLGNITRNVSIMDAKKASPLDVLVCFLPHFDALQGAKHGFFLGTPEPFTSPPTSKNRNTHPLDAHTSYRYAEKVYNSFISEAEFDTCVTILTTLISNYLQEYDKTVREDPVLSKSLRGSRGNIPNPTQVEQHNEATNPLVLSTDKDKIVNILLPLLPYIIYNVRENIQKYTAFLPNGEPKPYVEPIHQPPASPNPLHVHDFVVDGRPYETVSFMTAHQIDVGLRLLFNTLKPLYETLLDDIKHIVECNQRVFMTQGVRSHPLPRDGTSIDYKTPYNEHQLGDIIRSTSIKLQESRNELETQKNVLLNHQSNENIMKKITLKEICNAIDAIDDLLPILQIQ